jgi:hypothetical protein
VAGCNRSDNLDKSGQEIVFIFYGIDIRYRPYKRKRDQFIFHIQCTFDTRPLFQENHETSNISAKSKNCDV